MSIQNKPAQVAPVSRRVIATPAERRDGLLSGMRVVTLRLRLLQAEIDQLGIFLRNGWATEDEVEASLIDMQVVDLAFPQLGETA